MKLVLGAAITAVVVLGCERTPEPRDARSQDMPDPPQDIASQSVQDFMTIKNYVLARGDRQTYCNMYNNNPHAQLGGMDIYLNPDTGQQNINCDPKLSDFNHMVIRTRKPTRYHRIRLAVVEKTPHLVFSEDTDAAVLRELLSSALANITE